MFKRTISRRGIVHWLTAIVLVALATLPLIAYPAASSSPTAVGDQASGAAALPAGWQAVYTDAAFGWRDIHFSSPASNIGFAVGGPPTWESGGAGKILKTIDGGASWQMLPTETPGWLRGVYCKNESTCWIAGRSGLIRRTTDGGSSWQDANKLTAYGGWLYSVTGTGDGDTILAGATCNDVGNFLRAADGFNFDAVKVDACYVQWDISCPLPGRCFSAANNAAIYRSYDNGVNWTHQVAGWGKRYTISCTDQRTCWVGGEHGEIFRTIDGGWTWTEQLNTGNQSIMRIRMISPTQGYAIGDCCVIYRTTNGLTWTAFSSPTTSELSGLYVRSMNDFFVTDWAGNVWRYYQSPGTPTVTPTPTATIVPPENIREATAASSYFNNWEGYANQGTQIRIQEIGRAHV